MYSDVKIQAQHFLFPVDEACGGQVAGKGTGRAFAHGALEDHVLRAHRQLADALGAGGCAGGVFGRAASVSSTDSSTTA